MNFMPKSRSRWRRLRRHAGGIAAVLAPRLASFTAAIDPAALAALGLVAARLWGAAHG